jgi:tRNA(adenine34) deaminase
MDPMHRHFMQIALDQARLAEAMDEVPVGAVLIDSAMRVLAMAHNETIARHDPSAHAEILALRGAAQQVQNYRLLASTLYVTVEPCIMCMGAIIHARVGQVVFGASDPKWGAAGSLYDFAQDHRLNHQPEIIAGICADECRALMRNFFAQKRKNNFSTLALDS